MPLTPGTRLGPYEVVAPLGAGGMGEVYRARDTRLGREVAVKVLPTHLTADVEARRRFEREARTLAGLNHPNICAVFDVGDASVDVAAFDFLVMELLEGESLAARLERGALPLREALAAAADIADALDAAHQHGIVHRDLKPANVMLLKARSGDRGTPRLKLLDFGLAKAGGAIRRASVAETSSGANTVQPLTGQGVILGTVQYMAPEQVEGLDADARTDIFALGAVLYEMLTGQRAFSGATAASVMSAILKDEPRMDAITAVAPPVLDFVIRTCLAKDPAERWQSAADVRRSLVWLRATAGTDAGRREAASAPAWQRPLLAAMLAAVVAGVVAWTARPPAPQVPRPRVSRFTEVPPYRIGGGGRSVIAISPDGQNLAVTMGADRLHIRPIDALVFRPLADSEQAVFPVFSPDGRWIAYITTGGTLRKIPVGGGPPITICEVGDEGFGVDWKGNQLIFSRGSAGVFSVPDGGGEPRQIVAADASRGEVIYGPQLLPDGVSLLFTAKTSDDSRWDDADVVVQRLDTGRRATMVTGGTDARYVPTGHLVFVRQDALFAQAIDLRAAVVTGAPVQVADGLRATSVMATTGARNFAIADDGTLIHVRAIVEERELIWRDRSGGEVRVPAPPMPFLRPRVSPDGRRILFANQAESDLYVWDEARQAVGRVTTRSTGGIAGEWSADGQRVLLNAANGLFSVPANGSGERILVAALRQGGTVGSISADGRTTLLTSGSDILVLAAGEQEPRPLIRTPFVTAGADLSRDGKWLVYYSNESGRNEVYVRPYPEIDSERWQVSTDGGEQPKWTPDGRGIVYQRDAVLYEARVDTAAGFRVSRPLRLFEITAPTASRHWDISPDGSRFITLRGSPGSVFNPIVIVQNWFEELRAKVPPTP